jgi:hypothetical protein
MKNTTDPLKVDLSKIDWKNIKECLNAYKPKEYSLEEDTFVYWPEIFETKNLDGKPDALICAYGLTAWANCSAGLGVHPNFGEVMVKIGERLGISPTGENLMEWSGKWLKKQKC